MDNEDDVGEISVHHTNESSGLVISRIERLLEDITDQLAASEELCIRVISRKSKSSVKRDDLAVPVRFPGRSIHETKKFARIVLLLQLAHSALVSGTIYTKRHVFYQHQELFQRQSIVDELVDDVAATLHVDRHDLNIVASAKGIFCGPLIIYCRDGSSLDGRQGDLGTPVPMTRSISKIDTQSVRWLLVVEKDAIFRSLVSTRFWENSLAGPGIILTAKGFPDLMTRAFLVFFQSQYPNIPMFALTDFDPYGIHIFGCYAIGSKSLEFDSSAQYLRIQLLGIKSKHLLRLVQVGAQNNTSTDSTMDQVEVGRMQFGEPISQLTLKDRLAATSILRKFCQSESDSDESDEAKRNLQLMIMLGLKAEIQWLDDSGNISTWLETELNSNLTEI
ncbi:hypothetical protein VHEMI05609 [[Torrubiella] hemipterigena]|uniref:DNA topoisomerase (ATP-hydrolyzing) n=1 Tax=[Torrubiella] hemipterigena TaxID=1531966 RepID=A0A0A1T4Q0_9HYPO|nr:hypothetical protein VHEMI05609 [[Torrubiella] hemipterigena]